MDRLRLYRSQDVEALQPPPPPPVFVNDELQWHVDHIVDHQQANDEDGDALYDPDGSPHLEYLVCWEGYTADDTWDRDFAFKRCRQLVEEYRSSHRLPRFPPRGSVPRMSTKHIVHPGWLKCI